MDTSYLAGVACQWFFIGLTTGVASGMILSALMRWLTDSQH